eukprot:CAMPEP_0204621348 /NCGR_PEP_ID=MMETSP0717-20131115/7080_1 /ASSEMBLY_ACC=CAM_ASM_000666 /TAXON_ID=230516 /ORGANISM="Chaetoceros curvisetus" /LENGTH=68 /DNA_ID=CAMNT_0051635723 /DNA_START=178 /DNA_END=384 /DNA_ORIENTATION=+
MNESYAAALNNLGNLDRTQSIVGSKSVWTTTTTNPDDNDDGIHIGNEEGEVEEEQLSTIEERLYCGIF